MTARGTAAHCLLLALACALLSPARPAQAAERTFPAGRLQLAVDDESILQTHGPAVPAHLATDVALVFGYEHNPLFSFDDSAGVAPTARRHHLVDQRLTADLVAGFGLFDWLLLGVDIPAVVFQARDAALAPLDDDAALSPVGLGDPRVDARLRILRQQDGLPFDLAVQTSLWIPTVAVQEQLSANTTNTTNTTTAAADYFGSAAWRVAPMLLAGRSAGPLRGAANIGLRLVSQDEEVFGNSSTMALLYRLGLAWSSAGINALPFSAAVSLAGESPAVVDDAAVHASRSPLEILGEVEHGVWHNLKVFVGGGAGIVAGGGVPDFRVFLGVRLSSRPLPDLDQDGIGEEDRCPAQPEDKDGFEDEDGCPDDNDADGVADHLDQCPAQAEDRDGFLDEDGCPDDDNDNDGVIDNADRCRDEPEDKDGIEDGDGCPEAEGQARGRSTSRQMADKKAIQQQLGRRGEFQACYESAFGSTGTVGGKLVVEFTITEAGIVQDARVVSDGLSSDVLSSCVLQALRSVHFKGEGSPVLASYTFVFVPPN